MGLQFWHSGADKKAGRRLRLLPLLELGPRFFGALALSAALILEASAPLAAKTPGALHCFGKFCHRVATLDEMDGGVGRTGMLKASYYDDCRADRFNTCALTSSGEVFRPSTPDNAASPVFPDGTVILAYHPKTRKAAVLRINSTGPYCGDRTLDVSRATAEKLGFREQGVVELMVAIVRSPEPEEAHYRARRIYPPVPGYMGMFKSFGAAHDAAIERLEQVAAPHLSLLETGDTAPLPPAMEPEAGGDEGRQAKPPQGASGLPAARPLDTGYQRIELRASEPETSNASPLSATPELLRAPAVAVVADKIPAAQDLAGHAFELHAAPAPQDWVYARAEPWDGSVATEALPVLAARDAPPEPAFWQRFASFLDAARAQAHATSRWRSSTGVFAELDWRTAAALIYDIAREKARASVVSRRGPLYRLTAELKLKAQPIRR